MVLVRLTAITAFAAFAAAQVQPVAVARRPALIRVVDESGAPREGVQVTLAGGAAQFAPAAWPVDVQRVATDARGRATARVLPDVSYVAWVCEVLPGGDKARVADPVGYFGANAMLDLACHEEPVVALPVRGAGAWQDLGPLRYFLVTPHPGAAIELAPDAAGALHVPSMPECDLDVRTAAGDVLWSRSAAGLGAGDALVIPLPSEVRVTVTDDQGKPLPGARIRHRVVRRSVWRLDPGGGVAEPVFRTVGIADAEGRAVVRVPFDGDPLRDLDHGEMLLYVDAPGMPAVAGGLCGRAIYANGEKQADFAGSELAFHLARGEPLCIPSGIVPAGTVAQLVATCKLRIRANSYLHDPRSFTAIAGADGAMVFDGVPEDVHGLRISLLLDEGDTRMVCTLVGDSGRRLPAELQQEGRPLGLACGELAVAVVDGRGGPARGCVVCVMPTTGTASYQRDAMARLPLDGAGRARVRLGFGSWVLVAMTSTGVMAATAVLSPDQPTQTVEMRLEEVGVLRVRLLDDRGEPVVGARLRLAGTRRIATGDGMEVAHRYFKQQMQARWDTMRTDADGRLDLPVVAAERFGFDFTLVKDNRASERFALEARGQPLVLRLK